LPLSSGYTGNKIIQILGIFIQNASNAQCI